MGFVERMNRTLLDEHFRVKGREKWYTAIEEIQADLDVFLLHYNTRRTHQGYRLQGRTPVQALKNAVGKKKLPSLDFCTATPQPNPSNRRPSPPKPHQPKLRVPTRPGVGELLRAANKTVARRECK